MLHRLLPAMALMLLLSANAAAQGLIIPRERLLPPDRIIPRPMPIPQVLKIKSIQITTNINLQVATTKVEQVFTNDTPYVLEGTYVFPVPESASLSEFAIYDGDKRVVGEVMERKKARQIYDQIVRSMRDPGLLEYVGKDLFQASVFPIPAKSDKKIELIYTQVLKNDNGQISYRYPLGSGQRALDAPTGQVSASVQIASPIAIKNIFSPSHQISITNDGERKARVSFEVSGEKVYQDFQLFYNLSDKDFGASLLTYREPGKDGYFLLLISPKLTFSEKELVAKDVVFILDTSGSMSGEKIKQAKAALMFGVRALSERDRFNLISFSGEERLMDAQLVTATQANVDKAIKFIDSLRAEGGTNIHDALIAGLKLFESNDRPRMLVFLTDGLPTVGVTDIKRILDAVAQANKAGVRLFVFGVGYDVNTHLLDKLADDNRGASDYVEPQENIEVKVSNFFTKINHPVLADLSLDFGGAETDLIYPRQLPDLFRGSQIALIGRYKDQGDRNNVTIKLTGKVNGRERRIDFDRMSFPLTSTENQFLPRLWAVRRVAWLMDQIRLNGETAELRDEVVALGARYGIVTPYTSYLITEDDIRAATRRGRDFIGVVPGDSKTETRMAPGIAGAMPPAPLNQPQATGQGAVQQSKAIRERMKQATVEDDTQNTRTIGNKTFVLKNGVWTDTEFKEGSNPPVVDLKFGSDQYFDLVTKEPKLAEFFALGKRVVVVFNGKVYRVEE